MQRLVLVIVEDDEKVIPSLAALIDAGFHVRTSSSSDEALALLQSTRNAFSAVIFDAGLAFDRTPAEIIRCVRAVAPDLPMLQLRDAPPCATDGQELGIPSLAKPLSPAALVIAVTRLLSPAARDRKPKRAGLAPPPLPGELLFRGGSMSCVLRDVSIAGASLEVPDPDAVPDHILLSVATADLFAPCRVSSRAAGTLGLTFE